MRQRIRPLASKEVLAEWYSAPHDHRIYGHGHRERVEATIEAGYRMASYLDPRGSLTLADLSCGNAAVLTGIEKRFPVQSVSLITGDIAPGWTYEGPIEETILQIPQSDLFVCAETLEHLDDPDSVLKAIREKARALVLSTPVWSWDDTNGQHLWAWSVGDILLMLEAVNWRCIEYSEVDTTLYGESYVYGIWGCI